VFFCYNAKIAYNNLNISACQFLSWKNPLNPKIDRKISIGCQEIAFYPVGHFLLSHRV